MKNTLLFLCIFSCLLLTCNKTTLEQSQATLEQRTQTSASPVQIFLVRHAEKSKNDPRDPDLNKAGEERAQQLKYHLADADITTIYTTDYKRTRQTIQPLADALGLEPIIYNTDLVDIAQILKTQKSTGNILVAGHSNTTPKLANKLLGQEKYKSLDESVYNKLFIINKSGDLCTATIFQY